MSPLLTHSFHTRLSSDLGRVAALALGAQGIHCGTAFLATEESFAHDYHKARVVGAQTEDTVHTDAFAINWPPASPVRVIANSVTEGRSEERCVGKECVSTCRSRWSPYT